MDEYQIQGQDREDLPVIEEFSEEDLAFYQELREMMEEFE